MTTKSTSKNIKRKHAETRIFELMNDLDPSGRNSDLWAKRLKGMSDAEFTKLMKSFLADTKIHHLTFDVDPSEEKPLDMKIVEKVAKKHGVRLYHTIFLPHENPNDPEHPVATPTEVPVLMLPVRKMQQMISHKSGAAGDIDEVNMLTGQVTGDSKAARLSDAQTMALLTTGQTSTIKELLTVRADAVDSKARMLKQIESDGRVSYSQLGVRKNEMQSMLTYEVMLRGAGLKSDIMAEKASKTTGTSTKK